MQQRPSAQLSVPCRAGKLVQCSVCAPQVVKRAFIFHASLPYIELGCRQFTPDYSAQTAPIFQHKYLSCHSKATQMGGIVVDSYEALMKGGERGRMNVPDKAEESLVVEMLEGRVPTLMPFGADPLSPSIDDRNNQSLGRCRRQGSAGDRCRNGPRAG